MTNKRVELGEELVTTLFYFTKIFLGYDLTLKTHFKLCEFLNDRYVEEEDRKLRRDKLILMPRGSFKTTIVSISFVIQSIILNPNIRILIASETFSNAKDYLKPIKKHFEDNENLKLFGNYVSKFGWKEDEITVAKRTKTLKEPTVSCSGVEVTRTGMHYDLIIADDIVSPNNIGTKEQMDKVINFYRECTNLLERTKTKGRIIVVGTRWDFNDLYNHILENERDNFNVFIRSCYNPDGSLFFPEVLSEEELERQRKSLGSYYFSANYLNDPVDSENAVFKKQWIKTYSPKDLGSKYPKISEMNTYLHIDPAMSEKKGGDFTGFVVSGIDYNDNVFVLYAEKAQVNPFQMIQKIFSLYQKYNCRKVLLETQVFQRSIKFFLYDEMKKRRTYLPIDEIEHSWQTSKKMRISGLQPRFEFGQIYIRSDMKDLEDELLKFPIGRHDDLIDALSFGLKAWKKPPKRASNKVPVGSFKWLRNKVISSKKDNFYIGNQEAKRKDNLWSIKIKS